MSITLEDIFGAIGETKTELSLIRQQVHQYGVAIGQLSERCTLRGLNEISLTGNLATRTINFNTRAGLAADNDIPVSGVVLAVVYIVPEPFDASSPEYVVNLYFNKTAVGTTFVSAYVKDIAGTILWAE